MPLLISLSLLLAPSSAPLEEPAHASLRLEAGDRICLLGGALAERMQHHGWLETELHTRLPELRLTVRNLGFGADELTVHQRSMNFGKMPEDGMASNLANGRFVPWDRYLARCDADVVWAFFGYNESFAGLEGLEKFESDLESFIDHVKVQEYSGDRPTRLVLFSSTPFEESGDPNLPDAEIQNTRIRSYNQVIAKVAAEKGVGFVDVFDPMLSRFALDERLRTINGIHLNDLGNSDLADVIVKAVAPERQSSLPPGGLREAVLHKNLLWHNRYRATDGYNVHGGRSRQVYASSRTGERFANFDVLQREMEYLEELATRWDARIHGLAHGEDLPVDTENLPPLIEVETNKLGPGPDGSHLYTSGREAIAQMTVAPGTRVELFADEVQFPELVNPVQMAWDPAGRLWVAAWPTYPHWRPDQPLDDKLLVLEDLDGDGRADECTVFADDLHNPTGIEFWNGGVFVACAPDLLFLKDTDGDGRADHRERVLHGLSSADTHHAANSFVLGPDGALYFQEGTFHMTQIESPYGPVRNTNGCVWRYEPRTHRVERYIPYNYANPHGHVFDEFGQDFMTDGTGNVNYYCLPFSGHLPEPQKHGGYFSFFQQRSRPCAATEMLYSRHFPEENWGSYLIANVIGFRGIFQYKVVDDGSGFGAVEMDPLVQSSDLNFRPADIEVGPDGAVYFLDWHNAIIGHLQHHIRDPSRDMRHGRVYRVVHEGRPLLERPAIAGEPTEEVVAQLGSDEYRTRYAARIELSARDTDEVLAHALAWIQGLDPDGPDHGRHHLEALWLHLQHNRVSRPLLLDALGHDDPRVRAAATRVVRCSRHLLPDALELLAGSAVDEHPRVRLEAVVAASFFEDARAASVALTSLDAPTDKFLDYALRETMRALEPHWKEALRSGEPIAANQPAGIEYLMSRVGPEELVHLPRTGPVLEALMTRGGIAKEDRLSAARELAASRGTGLGEVLLDTLGRIDGGMQGGSARALRELGDVLLTLPPSDAPDPARVADLAQTGRTLAGRTLGYATWLTLYGDTGAAWSAASGSVQGLEAFLAALPQVTDEDLLGSLHPNVRPLMFGLPGELQEDADEAGAGSGLDLAYFIPPPPDARLETLLSRPATSTHVAERIDLSLPTGRPDAFGLLFTGTIHVPATGEYTFFTNSDDGSRLYVDGVEVVENDGSHAMRERSGAVSLTAGAHALAVTYYDSGGGEGLSVSWKGPGIEKQSIPAEVLGRGRVDGIRGRAIIAMARIPGHDAGKLADAGQLLASATLLGPTADLLKSLDPDRLPPEGVEEVLDSLGGQIASLPENLRTAADVLAALEIGRELASTLEEDRAQAALERLDGLGGSVVLVRTLPHQMLYDLREFWVESGEPVTMVFQNNDVVPHNIVIGSPGTMTEIGEAAEALAAESDAERRSYVPDHPGVLYHTDLLYPGESQRLTFTAPDTPGNHPFFCTYPGHWRVMNGVLRVVNELPPEVQMERRTTGTSAAPPRKFVADWGLDDLAPLLVDGWQADHSRARGRAVFHEAGCAKCHSQETGIEIGGPDLAQMREKYKGAEFLRHILQPSEVIVPGYEFTIFVTDDGVPVTGRVVEEGQESLQVVTALLAPEQITIVDKLDIKERITSPLSPMPSGLLSTFTEEEILDLLSFLEEEIQ